MPLGTIVFRHWRTTAMSPDPAVTLVLLLGIGIVAGILFDRIAGPGWFKRQVSGATPILVTTALVGIAGSFVGYHLALLLTLTGYAAFIGAIIGAAVVLYGWRMVK
jgi:uncharacterized membrane protein YeaQ/YmgE (transglycosylase-associated protein family)